MRLTNNHLKIYTFFLCIILLPLTTLSQNKRENLEIFIFKSQYDSSTQFELSDSGFQFAELLTKGSIQDRYGNLDSMKILRFIIRRFPDKLQAGTCVIDWEEIDYKNLKNADPVSPQFSAAIEHFLICVTFIKQIRPNIRIGIYGLPFSHYDLSARQLDLAKHEYYSKILSKCDFLAPSLYISYAKSEKRGVRNSEFVQANLSNALKLGTILNKPVIPFIWHRIHPSNKKFGYTVMEEECFRMYIQSILTCREEGLGISGFFWWELSQKSQNKFSNRQNGISNNIIISRYKDILLSVLKKREL